MATVVSHESGEFEELAVCPTKHNVCRSGLIDIDDESVVIDPADYPGIDDCTETCSGPIDARTSPLAKFILGSKLQCPQPLKADAELQEAYVEIQKHRTITR